MGTPNRSPSLWIVRAGLPGAIALAGLVLLAAGAAGLGLTLIGVAIVVLFANTLMRLGIAGDADQDRAARARRFYDETGRWPDED